MNVIKPFILGVTILSMSQPIFSSTNSEEKEEQLKKESRLFYPLKEEASFGSALETPDNQESFLKKLFRKKIPRGVYPIDPYNKTTLISWDKHHPALPLSDIFTSKKVPSTETSASIESRIKGIHYKSRELRGALASTPVPDNSFKIAKLFPESYQDTLTDLLMSADMIRGVQSKDLIGSLALGPIFRYLHYTPTKDQPNSYTINLSSYENFPVKEGLARLGGVVGLHYNTEKANMEADFIKYSGKTYTPLSEDWQHKQKIILATLSTDITVVRQLLYNQLLIGGTFAAITNHYLPEDHPVRVLLHPYQHKTLLINNKVLAKLLKDKNSALISTFSYDQERLIGLIQEKTSNFYINLMDPQEELKNKEMTEALTLQLWIVKEGSRC